MAIYLKNLHIKKEVATITVFRGDRIGTSDREIKALAILLGNYNEHGRSIPIEEHNENMLKFNNLIYEISSKL